MSSKPLRIRFDEMHGFIKIYYGIRDLVLFGLESYVAIYNMIGYLLSEKSDLTGSINHNFAGIRIDSYNYLPIEKP